ncbi:MAG: molybdenum cofactor biosynthesis protein MoaE [Alphaproteobacteria bacterium]|nr:molybdenum cofactor biosynthesis protein MoaE [Alphaproteobacteria bacterium]
MIRVQREDFDPGAEIARLTAGRRDIGALVAFTGLVRDMSEGAGVRAMTLEHYPGMTEAALRGIREEAIARFALSEAVIVHRVGRLVAGERIVFAAAAAPHRADAFAACAFLVDYLKTRAPFWKKEETGAGARWVAARAADEAATARWEDK